MYGCARWCKRYTWGLYTPVYTPSKHMVGLDHSCLVEVVFPLGFPTTHNGLLLLECFLNHTVVPLFLSSTVWPPRTKASREFMVPPRGRGAHLQHYTTGDIQYKITLQVACLVWGWSGRFSLPFILWLMEGAGDEEPADPEPNCRLNAKLPVTNTSASSRSVHLQNAEV